MNRNAIKQLEIIEAIKKRYPHDDTDAIAKDYGLTKKQVENRANRMGLKKSKKFLREVSYKQRWKDPKEKVNLFMFEPVNGRQIATGTVYEQPGVVGHLSIMKDNG